MNHVHKVHNGCISQVENCQVTGMVDLGQERYQCTVFFVKRHLDKKYVDYKLYCFNYDKLHAFYDKLHVKQLLNVLLMSYTETVRFVCISRVGHLNKILDTYINYVPEKKSFEVVGKLLGFLPRQQTHGLS